MNPSVTARKCKWVLPILLFILISLPSRAQLYAGGGFSYYNTEDNSQNEVRNLTIAPELGYRYQNFSIGLLYAYMAETTHSNQFDIGSKQYYIKPYFRYDIIARDGFGFFAEAFYMHIKTNTTTSLSFTTSSIDISHLAGITPGVYYKLSDRLMALCRFGILGYSSDESNGFKGFGIDLSMNTTQIGFYYSFW